MCDGLGWGRFSAELGWGMLIFQTWTGGRNQVGFLQKTHDGVGWCGKIGASTKLVVSRMANQHMLWCWQCRDIYRLVHSRRHDVQLVNAYFNALSHPVGFISLEVYLEKQAAFRGCFSGLIGIIKKDLDHR